MNTTGATRSDTAWIAGSALLAWALFLLRFGYGFGFSDQDEFIPLAMRLVDGSLFVRDAFVAKQLDGFTIRMPIAWLVAVPSFVLPMWLVVFTLHMATGIGSGWAVARLAGTLTDRKWMIPVATAIVVSVTARWNPGGNDILHGMLVPSSLAWCLLLWAFERLFHRRYLMAGSLAALATVFHPLVGLQAGAVLVATTLFQSDVAFRDRLRVAVPWLIAASATVLLFSDLGAGTPEAGPSASTVLTHWRAPHHYLPSSFRWQDAAQLGTLFFSAALLLSRQREHPTLRFAALLLSLPAGFLLTSLAFTWWPAQLDAALRLQPWALSPLLRVWSTVIVVVLAAEMLPRKTGSQPKERAFSGSLLLLLAGAASLSLSLVRLAPDIRGRVHPDRELHAWAAENTDINAVFVLPPSMTGFQAGAQRAQYVSFKSFPFAAGPTIDWWNRLQRMAPVDAPEPGGIALQTRLDSSWAHRKASDLRFIVESEPVDFLVRPRLDPADWSASIKPQWCGEQWCVYWAGRILRTNPETALQ